MHVQTLISMGLSQSAIWISNGGAVSTLVHVLYMHTTHTHTQLLLYFLYYLQTYMAIHEAVKHNKLDIVKLLVELGADITVTNNVSHNISCNKND